LWFMMIVVDRESDFVASSFQATSAAAIRGGCSPTQGRRHLSRLGIARTMFGSTTMSLGPPIISRCSTLSPYQHQAPAAVHGSGVDHASRGIRRAGCCAEAVVGETPNQPCGHADQPRTG